MEDKNKVKKSLQSTKMLKESNLLGYPLEVG
jgi:hypothetical protein